MTFNPQHAIDQIREYAEEYPAELTGLQPAINKLRRSQAGALPVLAVGALVLNQYRELLMIRPGDQFSWGLIGGLPSSADDTLMASARRILAARTGMEDVWPVSGDRPVFIATAGPSFFYLFGARSDSLPTTAKKRHVAWRGRPPRACGAPRSTTSPTAWTLSHRRCRCR